MTFIPGSPGIAITADITKPISTEEMEEMQELNVNPLYKFCYEFFKEKECFGRAVQKNVYRGYQLLRCKILRIKILIVCWVRVGGLIILNGGWSPGSRVLTPRDSGEKIWYPAIAGKNFGIPR